ncbi:TolC family protein [Desulfopila sp. IMCC35008]|uniref:TolC family protein n=1 Tax=Desulfopila sp. IMCC35008 TaxID=2653858 RepID=UPI0013D31A46|nr:TolC family protein [Desulfopila sp. IMCC35008]
MFSLLGAQSSSALTLEEAIELAFESDANTKAEIYAAKAQHADGLGALTGYGPQLSVSGSYMSSSDELYPDNEEETEARKTDFNETELTVSFRQPLVDLEKASIAAKGVSEMDVAKLLEKRAQEDLLLLVHERFYNALSAKEKLRISQSESDALRQQVEHAKDRITLGFGTITDQYDAQARYRVSQATEISNKTSYDNAIKALEETVGQPVQLLDEVDQDSPLSSLEGDLETWLLSATENNTDLSIKRFQYEAAKADYRAKQSRFLPTMSAFADYTERDSDDGLFGYGEERTEFDVGVRLDLNLLAGGTDAAATVAASKRKLEARERVNAAMRTMERSVSSLWGSLNNTVLLMDAYQLAVEANENSLIATKSSYTEGVKTLLDVLNAQQDYYRALGQYKTTKYEYLILLQRFKQVVGSEKTFMQI